MGRDLKVSIRKCGQALPAILLAFTLLLSGCGAETISSQISQNKGPSIFNFGWGAGQ